MLTTVGAWAQEAATAFDVENAYRLYNDKRDDVNKAWTAQSNPADKIKMSEYDKNNEKQVWWFEEGNGDNAGKYLIYNAYHRQWMKGVQGNNGVGLTSDKNQAVYYTMEQHGETTNLFKFYRSTNRLHCLFNDGAGYLYGWTGDDCEYFYLEEVDTKLDYVKSQAKAALADVTLGDGVADYYVMVGETKITTEDAYNAAVDACETIDAVYAIMDGLTMDLDGKYVRLYNAGRFLEDAQKWYVSGNNVTQTVDLSSTFIYTDKKLKQVSTGKYLVAGSVAGDPYYTGSYYQELSADGGAEFTFETTSLVTDAYSVYDGVGYMSDWGTNRGNKLFSLGTKDDQWATWTLELIEEAEIEALKAQAMLKTGLGYPKEDSEAYLAMLNLVPGTSTIDDVTTAINNYCACEDVEMPVPGKAYYIKAWWRTDGERGMTWSTNMYKPTAGTDGVPFVCQKVGEKYIFVSDNGYYLGWEADGKTGFTGTSYVEGQKFTVEKADLDKTGGSVSNDLALSELLGMFCLKANSGDYLMFGSHDNKYHNGSVGSKHYGHTSANTVFFVLAEAEYTGNTVNVNDAAKVGETCVATYCAPYATALPDGYKAYYIETLGEETAQLVELTTDIPANEGVIISGTSGDVTLSLSTQNPAVVATNKLKGVTVATDLAADVASGSVYLLKLNDEGTEAQLRKLVPTEGANTTLAANKAYLYIENESSVRFFNFAFDEGTETSIDSLQSETESEKTAIYDLAGRRVQKAQKGLYIINGKKVVK